MQKVRRHPTRGLRPLVGNKFQILFHSPNRGTFHLSLTVLVHYRSIWSIQPYAVVGADSHLVSRVRCYSGTSQVSIGFRIQGFHLLWPHFPERFSIYSSPTAKSYNPARINPDGLGCSDFARRYLRNRIRFLFLRLLRCFNSAGVTLISYFIQILITVC